MKNFKRVLEDFNLVDGGYLRPLFTLERGNLSEINIRDSLDTGW